MDGYIIAASTDTTVSPDSYWNGTTFVSDINDAEFYNDIGAARISAGNLQVINTTVHIEAYPATKTIVHEPSLVPGQAI